MIGINAQIIANFGHGDIKVTAAFINRIGVLSLKNSEEHHPIGSIIPSKENAESIYGESPILLEFESLKSLETVILKLQQIRGMMLGVENDDYTTPDITTLYEPNSYFDKEASK